MAGEQRSREISLEDAHKCIECLGLFHKLEPGKEKTLYDKGVRIENGGDRKVKVAVFFDD